MENLYHGNKELDCFDVGLGIFNSGLKCRVFLLIKKGWIETKMKIENEFFISENIKQTCRYQEEYPPTVFMELPDYPALKIKGFPNSWKYLKPNHLDPHPGLLISLAYLNSKIIVFSIWPLFKRQLHSFTFHEWHLIGPFNSLRSDG